MRKNHESQTLFSLLANSLLRKANLVNYYIKEYVKTNILSSHFESCAKVMSKLIETSTEETLHGYQPR